MLYIVVILYLFKATPDVWVWNTFFNLRQTLNEDCRKETFQKDMDIVFSCVTDLWLSLWKIEKKKDKKKRRCHKREMLNQELSKVVLDPVMLSLMVIKAIWPIGIRKEKNLGSVFILVFWQFEWRFQCLMSSYSALRDTLTARSQSTMKSLPSQRSLIYNSYEGISDVLEHFK